MTIVLVTRRVDNTKVHSTVRKCGKMTASFRCGVRFEAVKIERVRSLPILSAPFVPLAWDAQTGGFIYTGGHWGTL